MNEPDVLIPTKFRVISPDGSSVAGEVMWPREPGYIVIADLLEPFLDGGHIERVHVLADFNGGADFNASDMFVDENFVENELPRNEQATTIYRRAMLCGRSSSIPCSPEEFPTIQGTAILFNRRVWW